jgi:hypothetical protein
MLTFYPPPSLPSTIGPHMPQGTSNLGPPLNAMFECGQRAGRQSPLDERLQALPEFSPLCATWRHVTCKLNTTTELYCVISVIDVAPVNSSGSNLGRATRLWLFEAFLSHCTQIREWSATTASSTVAPQTAPQLSLTLPYAEWLHEGSRLVIGFIQHLQNVTTNNYGGFNELHTPKITVTIVHTKSSVLTSRCLIAAPNGTLHFLWVPELFPASIISFSLLATTEREREREKSIYRGGGSERHYHAHGGSLFKERPFWRFPGNAR